MAAIEKRISHINPILNAIVTQDTGLSWRAARASSLRWQSGRPLSQLDGVPFTVKDNLYFGGLKATWGSELFRDFIAPRSDIAIERLIAAGCVFVGKTNTPELAMAGYTGNRLFGITKNPWDTTKTPGGSSGGAAAAVASGMCTFAIGTDAGGSIRKPAAHTGIVGFKPSIGTVERRHGFPPLANDLQVIGTLTRNVADLNTVMSVLSDTIGLATSSRGLNIACFDVVTDSRAGWYIDKSVLTAATLAKQVLRTLGHTVHEVRPLWNPDEAYRLYSTLVNAGIARVMSGQQDWRSKVSDAVMTMAEKGRQITAGQYVEGLDAVTALRWAFRDIFNRYDLIMTPVTPTAGWDCAAANPAVIGGRPAVAGAVGMFTAAVSLAGCPAIALPAPEHADGLPTGIQLVAPQGNERRLIDTAAQYENAAPWQKISPFSRPGS
ncbi:amidase [Sodalis sp. RH22]|uniref:amidase n=1 Tax=unclassified Sodalis (in: enterobacteria) TaxID=2636512 RepID=UPI0039B5F88D